ncbi:MAG: SRPBCC domain-containing protein [Clostridia bacterium]
MQKSRPVGKTKATGFQVGVRRTFPITIEEAWDLIIKKGLKIWLGDVSSFNIQIGEKYLTNEGISGEVRVVNHDQNIRLTWKKESWIKASTLQIRTISNGHDKTTISFHQENLSDMNVREEMKTRWEETLNRLRTLL